MQITITQKDIEKYKISFTDTGSLIDELAYSANQCTSNEVEENDMEYEPSEPYCYNYEKDLFQATRTHDELEAVAVKLGIDGKLTLIKGSSGLQAGAELALNYPKQWEALLDAYTERLKEDRTEGISPEYNTALEKEIYSYTDDSYREWLNGDRHWCGVVAEIARFYTSSRTGEYSDKDQEYTFTLEDEDVQSYLDKGYSKREIKKALLNDIHAYGKARLDEETRKRLEMRAERDRIEKYKEERAKVEAEERKAKLLAMKL